MVKYHFAQNELGEIVDIDDVTEVYREAHSFYCLGCGGAMNARLGENNAHHFYHSNGGDCGYSESDLHRYAKKMLRKKFLEGTSFPVRFVQNVTCNLECRFFKDGEYGCRTKRLMEYDLKTFGYDTIEEEKVVSGGFVADLLISDSSGRNPEILLEIYVSHQIGENKEESGHRIIEIPVRNEEDLQAYLNGVISEAAPDEYRARVLARTPHFYGFQRDTISGACLGARSLPVASMRVDYSIECTEIEDNISCSGLENLYCEPDELIKVVFDPDMMYSYQKRLGNFIRMVATKEAIAVKNCKICLNGHPRNTYDNDRPVRCVVSDDYNLDPYPLHWAGVECNHFVLSKEKIDYFEQKEYAENIYQVVKKWPKGRISYETFRAAERLAEQDGFIGDDGRVNLRLLSLNNGRALFSASVFVLEGRVPEYCIVVENGEAHWADDITSPSES